MPRLFIGIRCTGLAYLPILQNNLKNELHKSKINWVDPCNFHITLKFLGDVEEYYTNSICLLLENIAQNISPISLVPKGAGMFGQVSNPKVIWFGFREDPELLKLQQLVEKGLEDLGFQPEEKKFTPHLTLARVKQIGSEVSLSDIINKYIHICSGNFHFNTFQLYESILHKQGPEYLIRNEFTLGLGK